LSAQFCKFLDLHQYFANFQTSKLGFGFGNQVSEPPRNWPVLYHSANLEKFQFCRALIHVQSFSTFFITPNGNYFTLRHSWLKIFYYQIERKSYIGITFMGVRRLFSKGGPGGKKHTFCLKNAQNILFYFKKVEFWPAKGG